MSTITITHTQDTGTVATGFASDDVVVTDLLIQNGWTTSRAQRDWHLPGSQGQTADPAQFNDLKAALEFVTGSTVVVDVV